MATKQKVQRFGTDKVDGYFFSVSTGKVIQRCVCGRPVYAGDKCFIHATATEGK